MSSRLVLGSKPSILVYSTKAQKKSPIRWGRKRDSRNICIGQALSKKSFPGIGMATRENSKGQAFTAAARSC